MYSYGQELIYFYGMMSHRNGNVHYFVVSGICNAQKECKVYGDMEDLSVLLLENIKVQGMLRNP